MDVNRTDPRAMPLDQYIDETISILETDEVEILAARARDRRDAQRPNEVAITTTFNDTMTSRAPRPDLRPPRPGRSAPRRGERR